MKEKFLDIETAYFTLEAALVLPLVMSAMLVVIYLFCFQYDRCLLEQDMGSLTLWSSAAAAEHAGETEVLETMLKGKTAELYLEKYVAWEMDAVDIRLEKNRLCVTGQGRLIFPVPGWNFWNDVNQWETKVSHEATRLSPVFYIRQYRKLKDQ